MVWKHNHFKVGKAYCRGTIENAVSSSYLDYYLNLHPMKNYASFGPYLPFKFDFIKICAPWNSQLLPLGLWWILCETIQIVTVSFCRQSFYAELLGVLGSVTFAWSPSEKFFVEKFSVLPVMSFIVLVYIARFLLFSTLPSMQCLLAKTRSLSIHFSKFWNYFLIYIPFFLFCSHMQQHMAQNKAIKTWQILMCMYSLQELTYWGKKS